MSDLSVLPGGRPLGVQRWKAWSPNDVHIRLGGIDVAWCIAAGWALDLFRGEITRVHEDIEIAVPAGSFPVVREALSELEFDVVGGGQRWPLNGPAFDVTHQTWGRDPSTGLYCLDVFREPHSGGTWIYRRDERVRLSYASVISQTAEGIPFMAPEIVLLFKAKRVCGKDEFDFSGTLPLLSADRRAWLIEALRLVHPEHRWLAVLEGCG